MYLKHLRIKNFRALKDIDAEFQPGVNVIVGPNAIGKTTVLEAIRLPKAIAAARTPNEATQTLMQIGAVAPHNPQQFIAGALVQDPAQPLEIVCTYQLEDAEAEQLLLARQQLVTELVQSRIQGTRDPALMSSYFSSPNGQLALQQGELEIASGLNALRSGNNRCKLGVHLDFTNGRLTTPDPIGALFITYLDAILPPDRTKFSYFPADRALPRGEQPIQLGSQDASQQIESHNSQPQLKYGRLKTLIFNTIIASEDGRQKLRDSFQAIFSGILKGRELAGAGINQHGLLNIIVKDIESGRIFDIDAMSSGEKGLVLTFLLIDRTLSDASVILLDEPELHLNPAVCKDLLSFMIDNYALPKRAQIILCSHSPEILAGAVSRDECTLYHLMSETVLTRVRLSDQAQLKEALRRLGTSESEGLLYKATVFVEGEHDIELLETGFGHILKKYKLKDLGGRNEVEKQIKRLQEAEKAGEKLTSRMFIFDMDAAPSELESTNSVKVLQWDRRCLENYLIDIEAVTDILQDDEVVTIPTHVTLSEISTLLKSFAMSHLDEKVAMGVYKELDLPNLTLRPKELKGKSFSDVADLVWERVQQTSDRTRDASGRAAR